MGSVERRVVNVAVTTLLVDAATKVMANVAVPKGTATFVAPVRNSELSLGIAGGSRWHLVLLGVSCMIAAGILSMRAARNGRLSPWIPGLVIGGSLGNLVDRALFGAVHDFLVLPWAVVNIADVAVVIGLAGWIVAAPRRPSSVGTTVGSGGLGAAGRRSCSA
jgi:signal peptidase II